MSELVHVYGEGERFAAFCTGSCLLEVHDHRAIHAWGSVCRGAGGLPRSFLTQYRRCWANGSKSARQPSGEFGPQSWQYVFCRRPTIKARVKFVWISEYLANIVQALLRLCSSRVVGLGGISGCHTWDRDLLGWNSETFHHRHRQSLPKVSIVVPHFGYFAIMILSGNRKKNGNGDYRGTSKGLGPGNIRFNSARDPRTLAFARVVVIQKPELPFHSFWCKISKNPLLIIAPIRYNLLENLIEPLQEACNAPRNPIQILKP